MTETKTNDNAQIAVRCHEIQTCLANKNVPEFETIIEIGMAVRLSLHIRGLPIIPYNVLKLVASHYLGIPSIALGKIIHVLAKVEFVRLMTQGKTIQSVFPNVPFYEDTFKRIEEFAKTECIFAEAEELAVVLVERLAKSPCNSDALRNQIGAESNLFVRGVNIGVQGGYLDKHRCRGRDILLNPTYFSESPHVFADAVAKSGANHIEGLLKRVSNYQGWPLSLIEKNGRIGNDKLTSDQLALLKRLAQTGMAIAPSIKTSHAGQNFFMFTPAPPGVALNPMKRHIYEKAIAVISAIRQGQLLPKQYAIRSPGALLYRLKTDLQIRANTEAVEQYRNLVVLRVGRLESLGGNWFQLKIIDTPENREALNIAYSIISGDNPQHMEVNDEVRMILQQDQEYVESLISRQDLQKKETISLAPEQLEEIDNLLRLGGRD